MTDNFEHNRFLYVKEGNMHFGCVNPFCGHGSPAMPRSHNIPMETTSIIIKEAFHKGRTLTFDIITKKKLASMMKGN